MEQQKDRSGFPLKNLSKQQWMILVLLGLLLVVIALPTAEDVVSESAVFTDIKNVQSDESAVRSSDLELQLEQVLSRTEGVGNVQIMLNMSQDDNSFSSLSDTSGQQKIQGALIVAEGGDDPVTVRKIQEAVMALFQIEAHKIKVMKMK